MLARIASQFSWPKIFTDVTLYEFVTCTKCQMTYGRRVAHTQLLPFVSH